MTLTSESKILLQFHTYDTNGNVIALSDYLTAIEAAAATRERERIMAALPMALHRTGVGCVHGRTGLTCGPADDRLPRPHHESQANYLRAQLQPEVER